MTKPKKNKRKVTNKEKLRRIIQSQRATQGFVAIGNIEGNAMFG